MPEIEFKDFTKVLLEATRRGDKVYLELTPVQLTVLHGMVALAMKHPTVKNQLEYAYHEGIKIREDIKQLMLRIGFSAEQVKELDTREI
jgi:hypothetical protein